MPVAFLLALLLLAGPLAACSDGTFGRQDRAAHDARLKRAGPNPSPGALRRVASADAGRRLFGVCAACHTIGAGAPDLAGPNLHGVMGRAIAGRPGFGYSYALQQLSGRWDAARMDAWLAAPRRLVPGTSMAYPGLPDALDRADMIAYLETQGEAGGGSAPAR